jgi:hypothetical protein
MHPTLVSLRSALSTLLMPSASHSCARLIPGRSRTNASTLCATVAMPSNVYSLASAPSNGTRRGLTRVLNTGPVTNHAAPARPPQPPEQRMQRSTSPTVRLAPWKAGRSATEKVRSPPQPEVRQSTTRQKPESSDSGLARMATRCPRAEALAAAM